MNLNVKLQITATREEGHMVQKRHQVLQREWQVERESRVDVADRQLADRQHFFHRKVNLVAATN